MKLNVFTEYKQKKEKRKIRVMSSVGLRWWLCLVLVKFKGKKIKRKDRTK